MRFAFAHKMSTYLMVWSAFFAVTLSGEVSGLVVLMSAPAIAASWFWEEPSVNLARWARMWTAVTALFFVYTVLSVLTTGDFLLATSGFILFLLVAKLYLRRTCRDYLHIYVLAFLLLVAGTVLNAELTYGIFFLGFVISSMWALTLFHLRREMEDNFLLKHSDDSSSERVQVARILNSRRIVGRRFFLGTSLVSITIFISAALLFLTIPRIGFGLFFSKSRTGVTLSGFSDGVRLGGHGVIKNDSTIVMRVKVDEKYEGRRAPYIHWRGVAFDEYRGGQWRRSARAPLTQQQVEILEGGNRHFIEYGSGRLNRQQRRDVLQRSTRQEIYLEPLGNDVMFGAAMPVAFEFDQRWKDRPRRARNDEIRHPHSAGMKYVVYSELETPPSRELRALPRRIPKGYGVYTQLPDEISERTSELSREITAGETNDYDRARAIESWLQNELEYTLQLEEHGDREAIDFFLFTRKRGHCEYFSSAMTVMLRTLGVPARNVNGFLGGEWNEYDDYIAVRAGDAHSWVEVYFDGHGWVTFDPTPSATVDVLGRGSESAWARLKRIADTLRFKWFKWVIEYDLGRQIGLFRRVGRSIKKTAKGLFSFGDGGTRAWLKSNKRVLIGGGLALTLLVVFVGWYRRRRTGSKPTKRARSRMRRASPIVRAYFSAEKRYRKLGHVRHAATTPREHASHLVESKAPGADAFVRLAEAYYRAVWGGALESADAQTALEEIVSAIEAAP